MTASSLKVGDVVMWRGRFGLDAPVHATVTGIQMVEPGEQYGDDVGTVPWRLVPDYVVVDLDNGRWAYGEQISPAVEP